MASKADDVFESLHQAILDGDIMPGARLLEQEVADKLDVSRTPVREAFARLGALGMLRAGGQGRGQIVTTPTTEDVLDAYAMREVLEGLAAAQAAQKCGEYDAMVLNELLSRLGAAFDRDDVSAAVEATWEIHRKIWDLSGNELLVKTMRDLSSVWARLNPSTYHAEHRGSEALAEHRALIAAITEGRPGEAERLAREHIALARATRIRLAVEAELAG